MNTYTVTIADAHSNSVEQAGVEAGSKLHAIRNVLDAEALDTATAALETADSWTVTVTQP